MLPAVARCLRDMGPRELSNCCYSLALLKHDPPAAWLELVMAEARGAGLISFSPRDLSTTTWALGSLRPQQRPKQRQLSNRESGGASSPRSSLPPLASLSGGANFLEDLEDACAARMSRFNPQDLSTMAVGMSRMGHSPGRLWRHAFLERVATALPDCNPQVGVFARSSSST